MNAITEFFLRAKHWQLFLLLVGVDFVGTLAAMVSEAATVPSAQDLGLGLPFVAVTAFFAFCFLAWFWSMGSFLSAIVQSELRLKMRFFRIALLYAALYIFLFLALFQRISTKPALFVIIFPFHIFAMACIFYGIYFVSKSLVMAETGKTASFYDYAGPFFLIWFFPIGVWFTQPRINRLYAERKNAGPFAGLRAG